MSPRTTSTARKTCAGSSGAAQGGVASAQDPASRKLQARNSRKRLREGRTRSSDRSEAGPAGRSGSIVLQSFSGLGRVLGCVDPAGGRFVRPGRDPPDEEGGVQSRKPSRRAMVSASRQGRAGGSPAADHAVRSSTEYAGRGAGRGNAAVVVGSTRSGSEPISSNT